MLPLRCRNLTLVAGAVALLAIAWGQATAVGLEEAEWLRLDNGLRVILIPKRSTPLVASTVIMKAGARHEPPAQVGAAHFLEHLLFDGTTLRTQRELSAAIDRIGAYSNASTRDDLAIFQLLVHRDHLAEGLDLQADMLFRSTLEEEQVEKERGVVIEEIGRAFDEPQTAADRFFRETVFAGTPYRRPVLGTPASIEGLSRQAVWDFYQTFYQPANMTLVLMGGFERDQVLPLVRTTFGLPGSDRPLPQAAPTAFRITGRRVVGRRAEATRTYLTLAFNAPRPTDPDYPALATLVALLNAGPTSRLERLFRSEESPTVYTVAAGLSPTRDAPLFTISATLPPEEDGPTIIQRLLEELERIASGQLADEAVERARVGARAREVLLAENILYYAFDHAPLLADAPPERVRSFRRRLERVTREAVVAAARRTLSGQPFLATLYGPAVPQGERSWDAGVPRQEVEGTPPPSTQAGGRPDQAIVHRTLANGLTVIVKEAPDTEVFALHLLARDRAVWEPNGKTGIAEFMHRLLAEGTAHRSADQIAQELAAMGARLKVTDNPAIPYDDYYHSPEYSYVRLEVMDAFAHRGLALLADLALYPGFPPDDVERLKRQQLEEIARSAQSARLQARGLVRHTLFGDHPLSRPVLGTAETVATITTEDLRAFHRAYFAPGNLIVSVVSPRPAEEVLGWLTFYFGHHAPGPASPPSWPSLVASPGPQQAETHAGKAQSYLYLGQLLDVSDAAREAATVMNALLAERLAFELRERRGLAYAVGSSLVSTQAGWYFMAGLGTREANLAEARQSLLDAIRTLQAAPPDEAEVTTTVNGLIGAAYRRRLTAIGQAYFLAMDAFRGRPLGGEDAWADRLRQVSPHAVQRVAQRLQPNEMVTVTVR